MDNFFSRNDSSTSHKVTRLINWGMIARIMGILILIECVMMLSCVVVSLLYNEGDWIYFAESTIICACISGLLFMFGRHARNELTKRDGYSIVSFTWVIFSFLGMLPFYTSGEIPSVSNAFFETMSGFTTTGASILDNIESLSHGMLFWRSLIQWIGGLGIIFFTITILPIFGVGNQVLFSAEATGVTHDKIHPKISKMTKWLWAVYLILTVVLIMLLKLGGMNWFDSICHSFTTVATGGYSTKQSSIAYWNSPFIEYVIAIFMLLASINYSLYYHIIRGKWFDWLKDAESKTFLFSVGCVTLMISVALFFQNHYTVEESFRKAFFQVVSMHTSCGYITDDYNYWPQFTWLLFLYTMLVGGCTGSTAGGIKSMRLSILLQNIRNELYRLLHPKAVLSVKINHQALQTQIITTVTTFIMLYLLCAFAGMLALMLSGVGFIEAIGVTMSSIGNTGPGLGMFGPAFSWNTLPEIAKWICSFLMLIGRLELLGVLLMFSPAFWEKR